MSNFPKVKLIAIGKVKKRWIQDGIAAYQKRIPELEILEIKDSNPNREAEKIQERVKAGDRLIVLTEEGKPLTSIDFAQLLGSAASGSLVFIIGGPEGIADSLKQHAEQLLSLSQMTFPHELARLLCVEQLYRAKAILQNTKYHK